MNTERQKSNHEQILVIGGGISGLQSAINIEKMGKRVVLIERSAALGGALPFLFRTYPECACCRIYGLMLEVINSPNIEVLTLAEVSSVKKWEDKFIAKIVQKPRYVDPATCISCDKCAEVCPVDVEISGGFGWGKRKAIFLPYPEAVPYAYSIDSANCMFFKDGSCGECEKICPTKAVKLNDAEKEVEVEVSNIVVASGFDLPDVSALNKYGYQLPNVLTSVEFERLLSISGPTGGKVICPGTGKQPERIAWIQCVGSRETKSSDASHCSSVCCMFAIKEAINAKEFLGESVETDIFFMDVRAFGKHFEEYANRAIKQNVNFKYTRIHSVLPKPGSDKLVIYYHNHEKDLIEEAEYDLVILSTGLRLSGNTKNLLSTLGVDLGISSFAKTDDFNPVKTSLPGIYVCGSVGGPKDIHDSLVEAGSVAAEIVASTGLSEQKEQHQKPVELLDENRVGVFLCDCPLYEIPKDQLQVLVDKVKSQSGVVLVETVDALCTEKGRDFISKKLRDNRINRVIITACAVTVRRAMFEELLKHEGLKPFMLEVIDLNEHITDTDKVAGKVNVFSLVSGINEAITLLLGLPFPEARKVPVIPSALVVGGGVCGMNYALDIANQGFPVVLVEKSSELGGKTALFARTWEGKPVEKYVNTLKERVLNHDKIEVCFDSEVIENRGHEGNFVSVILNRKTGETREINHGVTHLALEADEFKPRGLYCYGQSQKVLTLSEFQSELESGEGLAQCKTAIFIQCVGSRNEERPYCSRTCCTHAIASALEFKQINPDANIVIMHRDIRTYGLKEKLYQEALASGIFFVRFDPSNPPSVEEKDGGLEVRVKDSVLGSELVFETDRVILSTATIPNNLEVSKVFSVDLDENGFFAESHEKMKPVEFYNGAITMSGPAHAPKFLDESIAEAKAAVASAFRLLRQGTVEVGGVVAVVEKGRCAVCCTCVRVCPFDVPKIIGGASFIDDALCKGCGACVAECPGKAISLVRYDEETFLGKCRSCLA